MRDCGGKKQVDEQPTRENNLAAVPVFPSQVVRVYIHFFVLVSSARSNRTHGMVSYIHNMNSSDALYVSQVNCNSMIESDEPDAKPYLPEPFFDGYGIY